MAKDESSGCCCCFILVLFIIVVIIQAIKALVAWLSSPTGKDFIRISGIVIGIALVVFIGVISGRGIKKVLNQKTERKKQSEVKKKRIKKEYQTLLLNAAPDTIEKIIENLKKIKYETDEFLSQGNYTEAVPFLEKNDQLYQRSVEILAGLGMETLIPSMKTEREMNKALLYNTFHLDWAQNYNKLSLEVDKLRNTQNFSCLPMFSQLLKLLETRIEVCDKFNYPDDKPKFEQLYQETLTLEKSTQILQQYRNLEINLNSGIIQLNQGNNTKAIQTVQEMVKDMIKVKNSIDLSVKGKEDKNNEIITLLTAINDLDVKSQEILSEARIAISAQVKGNRKLTRISMDHINKDVQLQRLRSVSAIKLKTPLHAKVVFLGESSVGKTHIILSTTGLEYSVKQGSTIGIDKFYLPVALDLDRYNTEICFWDLGGQWNFRAVNELFINEAAAVVLVFDITRPNTFVELRYWMHMLKATRWPGSEKVILIGNKIDVGGAAISVTDIEEFMKSHKIRYYYKTSAMTGEGIKQFSERLVSLIDWSNMISGIDSDEFGKVRTYLKHIQNVSKIVKMSELIDQLTTVGIISDPVHGKAILRHCQSQDMIQFGRDDAYVILNPVKIDKEIAQVLAIAAHNNGLIQPMTVIKKLKMSQKEVKIFFEYLVWEHICYISPPNTYIFPNVIHTGEPRLSERQQIILDSGSISKQITLNGPGDLIFNRITTTIAREQGIPVFISNIAAVWQSGDGRQQTVTLLHYLPNEEGGSIRFKCGGGQVDSISSEFEDTITSVVSIYSKGL